VIEKYFFGTQKLMTYCNF